LLPQTTFSPGDLAACADPYALLAEVRRDGPLQRSAGSVLVLGHREILAVLRSGSARSGFIAELYRGLLPPGAARDEMAHRINFMDPPDHPRVRTLVAKAFTPRRSESLEPYVRDLAGSLAADLAVRLGDGETVDLIAAYSHQVPSRVISELLGVPVADRDRLTDLADRVSALLGLAGLDAEKLGAAVAAAEEMHGYLGALFEERRRRPADDLVSALLAVEDEGRRLAPAEMLSLAATLYSAGHRTTRDLFSNGMAVFLADGDARAALAGGAFSAADLVEEFLRFETPTHYVARMLKDPLELEAGTIPADVPVALMLAAGNRDPQAYEAPERFEPRRWRGSPLPPAPVSFAFGPHFCLGASLARMEARVMVETLQASLPALTLAAAPLRWTHTGLFRALAELPVLSSKVATA
jgi:cytochrome P450